MKNIVAAKNNITTITFIFLINHFSCLNALDLKDGLSANLVRLPETKHCEVIHLERTNNSWRYDDNIITEKALKALIIRSNRDIFLILDKGVSLDSDKITWMHSLIPKTSKRFYLKQERGSIKSGEHCYEIVVTIL